jgi:succinyl-diaminopimelate desuccinylase
VLDEHRLKYSIDWRPMGDPFLTAPGDLSQAMQDAVERATGLRPKLDTGGGTSDGRFIAPMGAQVVEFGPRNASIHKIDECVAVKELEQLVDIYQDVLKRLLG